MTLPDLGPERPGHASDTRQMVEADRHRTASGAAVSNPTFLVALVVIVGALVLGLLLLR